MVELVGLLNKFILAQQGLELNKLVGEFKLDLDSPNKVVLL
jgi:hypothetical protein